MNLPTSRTGQHKTHSLSKAASDVAQSRVTEELGTAIFAGLAAAEQFLRGGISCMPSQTR